MERKGKKNVTVQQRFKKKKKKPVYFLEGNAVPWFSDYSTPGSSLERLEFHLVGNEWVLCQELETGHLIW